MNFDLSEEQQAVADLAGRILTDRLTHTRLKELEAAGGWAREEWEELARAGLVGIALPEAHGGAGLGSVEACLVLEQVGRAVAPVPYLATAVLGAGAVAEFGTPSQQAAWLPRVVEGDVVLTAALTEDGRGVATTSPATVAEPDGGGWRLSGTKPFVAFAAEATAILVPARSPDGGCMVLLVETAADGVSVEAIRSTDGLPRGVVTLDGAAVDGDAVLGHPDGGDAVLAWLVDRATAGVCATQAGVCARALEMIGTYTSERHQFDSPIATFQAVAHRAADAYIDTQAVRYTAWQAAWRLSEGLDASDALDVAKFWAAEGGQRVVHAAQHLHGGIGVDRDYPLHRYFLWAKALELTAGGATERLRRLGARIAAGTTG